MADSKKFSGTLQEALSIAGGITPSVLAIAQVAGVKPKDLAGFVVDADATSLYRVEVAKALQDLLVKKAMEQDAKAKEDKE